MRLPEWCQTHSLKDFFTLLEEECILTNNYLGSIEPNKGKNMNDKIKEAADAAHDVAFQPMDAPGAVGGPQSDGTISYKIVEGDTFIDGVKVEPKVVGYVQIDEEVVEG